MSFSTKGKHHTKTIDKIRIACRLQMLNLGMRDQEIAAHIGMSSTSYSLLKKTKIFQVIHNEYLTGVLSQADDDVALSFEYQRKMLARSVPVALENLLSLATQKIDQKLRFEASKELLDRHGVHAKVSRIGLPTAGQDESNTPKDNEVASELINALRQAKEANQPTAEVTIDSPPANEQVQ